MANIEKVFVFSAAASCAIYLMMLSSAQTIPCQIVLQLVNNEWERIWKAVTMV
jgi:hypothetical protein